MRGSDLPPSGPEPIRTCCDQISCLSHPRRTAPAVGLFGRLGAIGFVPNMGSCDWVCARTNTDHQANARQLMPTDDEKREEIRQWLRELTPSERARVIQLFCEQFGLVLPEGMIVEQPISGGIENRPKVAAVGRA